MMHPLFALILFLAGATEGKSVLLFDDAAEASYLDLGSGGAGAGDRIVWITHDYKKSRPDGLKAARDQWSISCERRTFSIFSIVEYGRDGKVLSATAVPLAQREPMPVPSGGTVRRVYDIVCGGGGAAGED